MERGSVEVLLAAERLSGRGTWLAVVFFVVAAALVVPAVRPRLWLAVEARHFRNPDSLQPRPGVLAWWSISSAIGALLAAGVGVWILATGDERVCQEALSDLEAAAEQGSSFWDDTALADRPHVQRVADEHGVTLDGNGTSVDVLDADGEVVGTVSEGGFSDDVTVEDLCGG